MSPTELVDFDDGHKPGMMTEATRLAVNKNKNQSKFVAVFDDLFQERWCDRIYEYSANVFDSKPWGVYVLTEDIIRSDHIDCDALWREAEDAAKGVPDERVHDLFQRAIGIYTSRQLLVHHGGKILGKDIEGNADGDVPRVHGTVVWCLCSAEHSSVEYHIDYAELYRYETNVIHPPLYAGTAHVSPLNTAYDFTNERKDATMKGGSFCVNTDGLGHYRKFGYKGKLAKNLLCDKKNSERECRSPIKDFDVLLNDLQLNPSWQKIRYRRNRGILHDGDFPHLSTPITTIPPGIKRCILGFNCFSGDVGECCMRAPEHSRAFNRIIRLYQTLGALSSTNPSVSPIETSYKQPSCDNQIRREEIPENRKQVPSSQKASDSRESGMSAKEIMKNPALARLLVKAAKLKKAHDERQLFTENNKTGEVKK